MGKLDIKYSKQAEKFLDKQNDKTFLRITSAVDKLPEGDVVRLQGYSVPTYRLTVSGFRVIFTREKEIVFVEKIDNRGQVYKN